MPLLLWNNDTDFSFDPQWLVENTKQGISVLRIVRRAAQILINSGFRVNLLEILPALATAFHRNFLPHTQFEMEPMAGIVRLAGLAKLTQILNSKLVLNAIKLTKAL
jgi:hypothetical protein